jgi:hypothetical protein
MKLLRPISFTLFLLCSLALAVNAQANSIKQMSFSFDRYAAYSSSVRILGDNIDVTAQFRSDSAPFVCAPCTPNTLIRFGPVLADDGIVSASGTIAGTFYPTLFISHNLQYQSSEVRIPRSWLKTVRLSTPVTLTGNLGVWLNQADIGIAERAVYLHNNMNFAGEANLLLRWRIENSNRFYTDKYLTFNFVYVD